MGYQLYQGDCLDILPTLAAGSVDAIVTDPPYGQTNEGYDRGVSVEVWRACYRVAREGAVLLSFAGSPTYHRIAGGIEAAGWRVRQMWAWVYRDGMITSAYPREGFDRLAPAMDPICYATKGKALLTLRREGAGVWERSPVTGGEMTYSDRASDHGLARATGHWPRAIVADDDLPPFEYFALSRTGGSRKDERTGHPNQKPLALMRWLVDKLPPGGTILDPYMGSATTGKAALEAGRDFIGIERDARYFGAGEQRLAGAQPPLPLAGD